MPTKDWFFQQQRGQRRSLSLAGRSAPHGRPRRGAIVTDAIKLRLDRVYYPDSGGAPTTHVFGAAWEPWELKGRFGDAWLGPGGTKEAIANWQQFVLDAQPVLVSWGDVISAEGIVTKFTPGRESEYESTYTLEIEIDEQPGLAATFVMRVAPAPSELALEIQNELTGGIGGIPSLPNAGDLKPSFLDSLEDLVSDINSYSAALITIANDFDSFVSGTIDQLERLRSGVAQTRTALNKLRSTLETTENDAALLARDAELEVLWFASRSDIDVSTTRTLALLDELDRQAEIAQRGRGATVYVARTQDTWEGISRLFFGGPEAAGRIRDANGVRYGETPIPGRSYQIPEAA